MTLALSGNQRSSATVISVLAKLKEHRHRIRNLSRKIANRLYKIVQACRLSFLLVCVQLGNFKCELLTLLKLIRVREDQNFILRTTNPLSRHKVSVYLCIKRWVSIYKIMRREKIPCACGIVLQSTVAQLDLRDALLQYGGVVTRRCRLFSQTVGILHLQELSLQVLLDIQVLVGFCSW